MFSCFSKYKYTYIDNPPLRPFKPQFDALLLTPDEVGQLYEIFRSADVDASGHITVQELFAHLATEATFFRDRVFNLFDEDGSGKIDFREFVLSLWNYCTLSKASLVIFAFDLYDVDSTGQLSPKEIHNMLVDLYGKTVDSHPQAKLINKELKAIDSVVAINVDRFRAFVTNHPALLFPAFQMQLALRQHILGVKFWNRCAEKRLMLVDGRRVALGDLSELNIHESAYLEVLDAHERAAIEEAKRRKRAEDAKNSLIGWLSQKLSTKNNGASVADASGTATDENGHPTPAPHRPLLHPRDEMAMLIIQSTGTHHYRKAVAQQRHQQVHALKARLDNHPLASNTGNGSDSVGEDTRLLATVYQQEQYESDVGQQYLMDIDRHKQHNANDLAVSNLPRTSTQLQRDHKFVGNYHASAGDKDKIAFQMKLQKMRSQMGTDGDGGGGEEEEDHPEDEEWMVKLYATNPAAAMKIVAEKEAMKKAQRTSLGVYERTMDMVVAERANINRAKSTPSVDGGGGGAPPSLANDPHPTRVLGHLAGQSLPSHSPRPQPGSAAASHGHSHAHGHGHGHGHHRGAGDHSPAPSRPHSARSRSASPMVSPRPAHSNLTPRRR